MCFPSSKNGGRRLCGSYLPSLNNTGKSGRQALRVGLCLFAGFVLLAAGLACNRKGREKSAKRTGASQDRGAAAQVSRPEPVTGPAMKSLPEIAQLPGKAAQRGGTLKIHLEAEPPHLNPLLDTVQVIDRVVGGLIYETLIECHGDRYQPGLADTWEVSTDGLRLTMHLKAGARWQDDKVFSGLDVQATLEHLMRSPYRSALLHAMIADLEGVDVLPEHMVRLRFTRPSDLTLRALCEIPILPAEPLRTGGPRLAQLGRTPIGTGPFRVAAWERGKRIKLVRSRPASTPDSPMLDGIDFEIDTDPARALTRVRRGEIDILPKVSEVHFPEQVSQATLRDALELYLLQPHRYSFVALNTRRGVLADPVFRRALSLLWDRSRFASEFHHGLVRPIGAPTFGTAPSDKFDRVLAGRLLDQAGFRDTDGDGVREVGGTPIRLTFLVPAGSKTLSTEVRAFAMDLRRAGILLDTSNLDGASLFSRVERGDFDLCGLTWDGRKDEDPRLLLSAQGDLQHTGYKPEKFTAAVDRLRVAPSPAARTPLLQQLADILATDRPALFLYRHDVPTLAAKRVHGLAAVGDRLDLRSIWVDP
jgi:peptide/nickel transport system substrate-binding protein